MIENHFLHAAAWSLLRMLPPKSAFRWTSRIGRLLPALRSEQDARRVADVIESRGTCLSRALTVAARLRDAEVVIGVDSGSLSPRVPFTAHAWVE
ncbi:MAG: lasso peptide biosynthesis B2 protein, partial [Polyangiaceae bacterium]